MFVANLSAQEVLAQPQPPFKGKIERTAKDSTPDFPKGAPNVLLILTDDVGFGATSVFGGPIQTPNFQRLADSGLHYTMFHTTARCSPTRAALITGRNHHSVASGVITEMATGYPGYNSLVPKSAGSVGEVLRENGYNTSWFGKMHNIPAWMSSQAGPFDCGRAVSALNTSMGSSEATPINGSRVICRPRRTAENIADRGFNHHPALELNSTLPGLTACQRQSGYRNLRSVKKCNHEGRAFIIYDCQCQHKQS